MAYFSLDFYPWETELENRKLRGCCCFHFAITMVVANPNGMQNIPNLNPFRLFVIFLFFPFSDCSGGDLKEIKYRTSWTTIITAVPITAAVAAIPFTVAAWNDVSAFTELSWWNCDQWSGQFQFHFEIFNLSFLKLNSIWNLLSSAFQVAVICFSEQMIICKICVLRYLIFQLGNRGNQIGSDIYLDVKKAYGKMRS